MEDQGLPKEKFSEPKISKALVIILIALLLLVLAEGGYYFYLKKTQEGSESPLPGEVEGKSYFEGPRFYQETNGIKSLLSVEGYLTKLNDNGLTITREDEEYEVSFEDINKIIELSYDIDEQALVNRPLEYKDLSLGEIVGFTPTSGTLVVNKTMTEVP